MVHSIIRTMNRTGQIRTHQVQRSAPFGPTSPKKRYTLDVPMIHPVVRIAHRSTGPIGVNRRIILDHELILVQGGRGQLHTENEVTSFEANDLLLIRPFVPHHFKSVPIPGSAHIAVHFDLSPEVPKTSVSLERRKPYQVQFPMGRQLPSHVQLGKSHRIARGLTQLVDTWERQDDTALLEVTILLSQVLLDMLRMAEANGQSDSDEPQQRNRVRLQRAIDMILKDPAHPWTADDLATAAGLSTAHFTRLFRQWTGRSPVAYLRRHRIELARTLLADVDLSIKQIAAKVGFEDQYHFSKAFRQIDGLSPTDYREALLANRPDHQPLDSPRKSHDRN